MIHSSLKDLIAKCYFLKKYEIKLEDVLKRENRSAHGVVLF